MKIYAYINLLHAIGSIFLAIFAILSIFETNRVVSPREYEHSEGKRTGKGTQRTGEKGPNAAIMARYMPQRNGLRDPESLTLKVLPCGSLSIVLFHER